MSKYRVFSGPYFPVFGLNAGKYGPEKSVNLRIQSEYGKYRPEKNPYLDIFHVMTSSLVCFNKIFVVVLDFSIISVKYN